MNYSPLRYPGGKAKLAPYIKTILHLKNIKIYIEPFAGGAGVGLDLLISKAVDQIIINDYDKAIYSFWRAVLEDTDELISKIISTEVTIAEWHNQKYIYQHNNKKYSVELAFATLFLNRTNRSGILSAGPIGGLEQLGNYLIDARYNKQKLIEKIKRIAELKKNIKVYNKEVRSFITQVIARYQDGTFVYFDPPYFNKGHKLYKNFLSFKDHVEIANYIKEKVNCDWIVTYDDVDEIKSIYSNEFYRIYELTYSIVSSRVKKEIMIYKNEALIPLESELKNIKINFI